MKTHATIQPILRRRNPLPRHWELAIGLLSFATLFVVTSHSSLQTRIPHFNFVFDPQSWEILETFSPCETYDCLRSGDRILTIDGLSQEEYHLERSRKILIDAEEFNMLAQREGVQFKIKVHALEPVWNRSLQRILLALIPLIFWLSGAVAFIFVRPQDSRWLLLVLYQMNTAILFAAGGLSSTHAAFSLYAFHTTAWLFLPLSLHLHLVLPNPLAPALHRRLLVPAYLTALCLIAWDARVPLTGELFLPYFAIALLISAGILLLRLALSAPPAIRLANRLMAFGVLVGVGPWLFIAWILGQDESWPSSFNSLLAALVAFLATPLWPLSYLYSIYKHPLGSIELRPNRLFGSYSFLVLYLTFFIATLFLVGDRIHPAFEISMFPVLMVSACFIAAAPFLASHFQQLVDQRLFGIHSSPEEIVSSFASKVPTTFDRPSLARLIETELLPPFQIRQTALFLFDAEEVHCLVRERVAEDFTPTQVEFATLLSRSGTYLRFEQGAKENAWIRLVVRLAVEDEIVGIWLLGQRDPDDYYSHREIELLQGIAGQMASLIQAQRDVIAKSALERQLVHAQKMEAVGRLTASVAHDFNNLLSAILGYGDLLLKRVEGDRLAGKYLAGILASGEKASGLTRQLLAYSRQQAAEVRVCDLGTLVRDVETLIARLAGEDITLELDLAEEHVLVEVDPGQLQQVILNLAANAVDAMPRGGRLTIKTRNLPPEDSLHLGEALLLVKDTGSGMPPEVAAHIFEAFYSTKEEDQGTGLGLAISREIVEQFGGRIEVSSTPDVETTFKIHLPTAIELELPAPHPTQTVAADPDGGHETVLLAEDEEGVRLVASEVLKNCGYNVLEARDGAEALDLQAHHRGPIELLLTDIMMPRIKGPELASRLCDNRPETRVLYMSGYSDDVIRDLGRGRAPGASLLRKPFVPAELARRVRETLDRPTR